MTKAASYWNRRSEDGLRYWHPLTALYLLLPSILIVLATLLMYLIVEATVWGIGRVLAGATKRRIAPPHPPLLMKERRRQTVPRS